MKAVAGMQAYCLLIFFARHAECKLEKLIFAVYSKYLSLEQQYKSGKKYRKLAQRFTAGSGRW